MDEQFHLGYDNASKSDGNQLANAGEFTRYDIVVRNTGKAYR